MCGRVQSPGVRSVVSKGWQGESGQYRMEGLLLELLRWKAKVHFYNRLPPNILSPLWIIPYSTYWGHWWLYSLKSYILRIGRAGESNGVDGDNCNSTMIKKRKKINKLFGWKKSSSFQRRQENFNIKLCLTVNWLGRSISCSGCMSTAMPSCDC